MGINPQLNMANMVAMQGRNTNMFSQGITPSPTTVRALSASCFNFGTTVQTMERWLDDFNFTLF